MSSNKALCMNRKDKSTIPTRDAFSDFRPLLFSVYDLSWYLHISVVQADSGCTEVSYRTSTDLNSNENKDFSKRHKKNKLCILNREGC